MGRRVAVLLIALVMGLGAGAGQALAYGYSYDYTVMKRGVDAELAFDLVRHDFEAVFPAAMPASNCGSELRVGLECDLVGAGKGHIRVEEVGSRHFVVRSLPGHAEGANKLINFTLSNNYADRTDDYLRLEVTASGKDNLWQQAPLTKRANRVMANQLWGDFAHRIKMKVLTYEANNVVQGPVYN